MADETASLDAPFAALAGFDWGGDPQLLAPLDAAVVACHGDPRLAAEVEERLVAALGGELSQAARQYVCRKLALVGTAASVPALAALLADGDASHMARFALERIPAPEAAAAIRGALAEVQGDLAIGMVSSLASRGDVAGVPAIARLVAGDSPLAAAAASALGTLATPEAAAALAAAETSGLAAEAVIDARLSCAEAFLRAGRKADARAIYETVGRALGDAPATRRGRGLRVACQRGLFATLEG